MGNKFKLAPGVNEKVALMCVKPIGVIAEEVAVEAKRLAPFTKQWITMRDGSVRRQHIQADGDQVPTNLRFTLTAYAWDLQHPGAVGPMSTRNGGSGGSSGGDQLVPGAFTYLLYPRDVSGKAYIAIVNCRCYVTIDQEGIRKTISAEKPIQQGFKVTALVVSEGDWVVQAEFGTMYSSAGNPEGSGGDLVSPGRFFMRRGGSLVAARRRAKSTAGG